MHVFTEDLRQQTLDKVIEKGTPKNNLIRSFNKNWACFLKGQHGHQI